jgi:hypothetical protein
LGLGLEELDPTERLWHEEPEGGKAFLPRTIWTEPVSPAPMVEQYVDELSERENDLAISDSLGIELSEIPQSQSPQESELLLAPLMPHVPPELKDSGRGPIHSQAFSIPAQSYSSITSMSRRGR